MITEGKTRGTVKMQHSAGRPQSWPPHPASRYIYPPCCLMALRCYRHWTREQRRARAANVADVLDAVVRLLRNAQQEAVK